MNKRSNWKYDVLITHKGYVFNETDKKNKDGIDNGPVFGRAQGRRVNEY